MAAMPFEEEDEKQQLVTDLDCQVEVLQDDEKRMLTLIQRKDAAELKYQDTIQMLKITKMEADAGRTTADWYRKRYIVFREQLRKERMLYQSKARAMAQKLAKMGELEKEVRKLKAENEHLKKSSVRKYKWNQKQEGEVFCEDF